VKSPNYFLQFSAKQRYYLYEAYTFNFLTCSFDNVYIKKLPLDITFIILTKKEPSDFLAIFTSFRIVHPRFIL